jgi:hypothetical protein
VLLSGDGYCEEEFCKEEFGEGGESQDGAQKECQEEHQGGEADEPVLAWVHAGCGQRAGNEGKL